MKKLIALFAALLAVPSFAQYTPQAGRSTVEPAPAKVMVKDAETGAAREEIRYVPPPRDNFGNATGATYDLAVDGAFTGQTVLVVDLYGQSFDGPRAALKEKGFSVVRYTHPPDAKELKALLAKSNQFWLLASCSGSVHLNSEHHAAIREFFQAGHGVYIWGDNDPCNADADKLASLLVDARVTGDLPGDRNVGLSAGPGKAGVVKDHLLSTGVEYVYEGITVATVRPAGAMTPVIYGSAGNLVAAAYEKGGRRLIVDGGYTRLSYKWDSAGTGRYIRNAAAWLANHERFGDAVVAEQFRKKDAATR